MNEQEIISYLKQNKEKGLAFDFMPKDVQRWVEDHRNEPIFMRFTFRRWEKSKHIAISIDSVYCLTDEYEPKPEFKQHWEEFDIDEDGYFHYEGDAFYYRDDVIFEKRYSHIFKGSGGWLYSDGKWRTYPTLYRKIRDNEYFTGEIYGDDCEPAYPVKIRFWRYKE